MVGRLLRAGADPNLVRPAGGTALMTASRSGSVAVVRRLIAAGADVDAAAGGGADGPDVGGGGGGMPAW